MKTKDKKNGKTFVDKSKPQRPYLKLVTKGKGSKIRCDTKIYNEEVKQVSPFEFLCTPAQFVVMATWWFAGKESFGDPMDKIPATEGRYACVFQK